MYPVVTTKETFINNTLCIKHIVDELYLALAISGRNIRKKDPMIITGVYSYNKDDILNTTITSDYTPDNAYSKLRDRFYRYIQIDNSDIPKEIKKNKKLEIYLPGIEMVTFSELIEPFKSDLKKIQIHVQDDNHDYKQNIEDILKNELNLDIELINENQKYSHLMGYSRNLAHNLYIDAVKNRNMPNQYSITPKLRDNLELISSPIRTGNRHLG